MNVNRNESFINTAAKLLERAKQQHQQQREQIIHGEENKEYPSKLKLNQSSVTINTSQQSINSQTKNFINQLES
jgi:hypothetical protein